jgi:hypothetical protein
MTAVRLSLKRCLALLFAVGASVGAGGAAAQALKLHVPSPDWRDQVIYFAVTDRFADGDPRNNDFGAGEFKAVVFRDGDELLVQSRDLRPLDRLLEDLATDLEGARARVGLGAFANP